MISWYKVLRNQGYSPMLCLLSCYYNNKHWKAEGVWPYGMKTR